MRRKVKSIVVFPGQGSQYTGMGKDLYDKYPYVREYYKNADALLGLSLSGICFEGSSEELADTANTQPALLLTGFASFIILQNECKLQPVISAGHSLGEITALCSAGALSFDDAIRLVRLRGELNREATKDVQTAMAAIKYLPQQTVENLCSEVTNDYKESSEIVSVANYNYRNQYVISGTSKAVSTLCQRAEDLSAAVIPIPVSSAFHSPLQSEAARDFKTALRRIDFCQPDFPVIANITALPYPNACTIPLYLSEHLVKPVRWIDTMDYIDGMKPEFIVEAAPGNTLWKMLKQHNVKSTLLPVNTADSIAGVQLALNNAAGKEFADAIISEAVCMPNKIRNSNENTFAVLIDSLSDKVSALSGSGADKFDDILKLLYSIAESKGLQPYDFQFLSPPDKNIGEGSGV